MRQSVFIYMFLMLFHQASFAQETESIPTFRGKSTFSAYMQSMLTNDYSVSMVDCAEFMISARFVIDENGYVDSISFSPDTPKYLDMAIKRALETTHGTWNPRKIDGKPVVSQPMILPMYFSLESVCDHGKPATSKMFKTIPTMLQFDGSTSKGSLSNVIIFDPIMIYAARGYEDIAGPPKKKN